MQIIEDKPIYDQGYVFQKFFKKALLLLGISFCITAIYLFFFFEGSFDGIKIKSGWVCIDKTTKALELLKAKSSENFSDVKKFVGVIECALGGSAMYAMENPPRYQVGDKTRDTGTIWLAGTIVHDANHSKLYHLYLQEHPGFVVPPNIWTGKDAEKRCLDSQYDALLDIGADLTTLNYVKNVINTGYWNHKNRDW